MLDAENIPDGETETIEQGLLAAERHAALREAFAQLPPRDKRSIALLLEDPPVPYAEISTRLGIPIGSIGPNRRRCLDKASGTAAAGLQPGCELLAELTAAGPGSLFTATFR